MSSVLNAKFPATRRAGRRFIDVPGSFQGFAVWGPYQLLAPGDYAVTFDIAPVDYQSPQEPCCRIDVATNTGREVILQKDLSVGDLLAGGGAFTTAFSVKAASTVEYRIAGVGGAAFRARYFRKAHPVGTPPPAVEDNEFYTENFGNIVGLERGGIRFALDRDELIAEIGGVTLEVQSTEDLQLLHEVFLANEYTVLPPLPCIAVDIGMNVGFTSLALARNPQIETIFAYEPFAAPFRRAARNFERNPTLAKKIRTANFGLADRDEDLEVKVSPATTISTSIRGRGAGDPERIRVRDAAEELRPKIEEAARRGLGVVMKVDCEGSEFAIFESLQRASLLGKIDAFMIEWHKWWSAEKTQADLVAPLKEAGFFVFDRTQPADPYAGFLQAVRSAKGAARLA